MLGKGYVLHAHLLKGIELDDVALDYVVELNLSYILTVASDKSKELLDALSNIYPPYKEDVMTVARQLERIGERRGRMEGKVEGKIEVAKNLLKLNLDVSMIQQATGLTIGELKEILQ